MLYLWKRNPKNAKGINHRKVRDHCHFTVKYRDAVHSIYNSKFKVLNEILVVFHNGSSYDKNWQMSLKYKLNVLGKAKKNTKLFLC